MASLKSSTLTIRIEPALKEALRASADREHRSIANMLEILIRDYCGRNGIPIPVQDFQSMTVHKEENEEL